MVGQGQTQTAAASYDAADRQASATDNGLTTHYGYDAAGQPRTQTIVDGHTPVTTTLDAEGRARSIAEGLGGAGPYTTAYGYNLNDLPITTSAPGGVSGTVGYNPESQLTHVGLSGPSTGSVTTTLSSAYDYGYNAVGWTTGLTATSNGVATPMQYAHDNQGRLTQWSGQLNGPESWGYGGNGNIVTNTEYIEGAYRTTVYTYTTAQPNEIQQQHTDGLGVEYFTYDQNGDTTSITSTDPLTSTDGVSTSLQYDSQARPLTITVNDHGTPVTVVMAYNAAGRRSRYTVTRDGAPTLDERFTYRGAQVGQAVVVSGTQTYTDTYLYDQGGAPYELLRQYAGQSAQRYWYEVDGHGNVVALTDINGVVVDRYAYDPWGEGLPEGTWETVPQPLRYAGYWWDKELGWYWVGVRSYDPEGRWLQPDPSSADGIRTYVYVADDPVDRTDPSGMSSGNGVSQKQIEQLLQQERGRFPNPVEESEWAPGKQWIGYYLGNAAHTEIGRYYYNIHRPQGQTVYLNHIPIRTILEEMAIANPGVNLGALTQAGFGLMPDILNATLHQIYEIKPRGTYAEGIVKRDRYIRLFAQAGVTINPGPTTDPGANGVVTAPGGYFVFVSPTPGIIIYRKFNGDFEPSVATDSAAANAAATGAAAVGALAAALKLISSLPTPINEPIPVLP